MGVSMATVTELRASGHDVVHLRDQGLQRLPDPDILAKAHRESRIVLTFDLDFGDLLALGKLAGPSVIIFRLADGTSLSVNRALSNVLVECEKSVTAGAIVLIEDSRYRVRSLPIRIG